MAGIRINNVTGAITVGGSGTPLIIQDDDGLTIKNGAGTNSVNLAASATSTLSLTGSLLVSGLTAGRVVYTGTSGLLSADANNAWDSTNSIQTISGRLTLTAGTLSTTGFSASTITATLPNTSTSETGISETITLNGTGSSVNKRGRRMMLAAGTYTSASSTILLDLNSSAGGTGTAQNIPTAASSGPANKSIYALTDGSTAGTNIGGYFEAKGGAVSIGAIGKCVSSSGVTSSVGLIGAAIDTGSTNSIGVFATLNMTSDPPYSGHGKCALVVDNGTGLVADVAHFSSQNANYMKIKNLGPIEIRTDPLASGVLNWDQQYAMTASSADESCMYRRVASAGTTSSGIKSGEYVFLDAGYTGAGTVNGIYLRHDASGTGADLRLNTNGNLPLGNIGLYSAINGSTATGYNVAVYGSPRNGLKNIGVIGRSVVSTNATHNVGLMGSAINASTANVGVFAGLAVGDNPTFTSAALYVSNGSSSSPIALFCDNTTAVFTVANDGTCSITPINPVASGANALAITATQGNGSNEFAVVMDITSSGNDALTRNAMSILFEAGATGSNSSVALRSINTVAKTGTGSYLGLATQGTLNTAFGANLGVLGVANGSPGTGSGSFNTGLYGEAYSSGLANVGSVGKAVGTANSPTYNVGSVGNAAGATNNIGVYAAVSSTDRPTLQWGHSAALVCDNWGSGSPIAKFLSSNSVKVQIDSSGNFLADTQLPNTSGGTIVHKTDGGISVQAGDATEGVKWRTLHVTTTNTAAQTEMTFDGAAVSGTSNTMQLANTTAHLYVIWITARGTAGTNSGKMASWRLEYVGNGDTGTAVLVGSVTQTVITVNGMTWDATASFTSARTQILVTGDAATTINWTAVVQETTV